MKLLRKLYDFFAILNQQIILTKKHIFENPNLILSERMVMVDETSKKPYFLISPNGNHSISKLFVEEFILNQVMYQQQFSVNDYGYIMYCIGGLQTLELNNVYQITTFEFEGNNIEVRHKGTMQNNTWNMLDTIATQKYLLLDKQSILKLGIFYQKHHDSTNVKIDDNTINTNLRIVK